MADPHAPIVGIAGAAIRPATIVLGAQVDALIVGLIAAVFVSIWLESIDSRLKAAAAVLLAITLDIMFNYTIACVLFLKLPAEGEWTFSQRVGNYKKRIDWRAPLATWICANLLDPFEVDGAHCK